MSDLYLTSLLLAAGVCLGFALHATTLVLQTRSRRYLYLLLIALLEAAYCITTRAYFGNTDSQAALPWGQSICAFTPYITYFFGELVIDLTGRRARWWGVFQRLNLGLSLAFSLGVVSDMVFGSQWMLYPKLHTDLQSAYRHRLSFTSPGIIYLGWVSAAFTLFSVLLFLGYRAKRDLLPMVLGLILYFVATIQDFGILVGQRDAYFVQHFGFFALVIGCWLVLSRRFELSRQELKLAVALLENQRRELLLAAPVLHKQKLDSLGTLAAGVAHEINNPLQSIMNYARLLKRQLPETSKTQGFAEEIGHESQRIKEIVGSLLRFGRATEAREFIAASVKDVLDGTLTLVRAVLTRDGIALQIKVQEGMPELSCRVPQLQQVIMNLVTNARDALKGRSPARTDERVIGIDAEHEVRNGEAWVVIEITDTGDGFAPELTERVFDPFFTTKPAGEGTGLGLSVSRGIVEAHAGRLTCQSHPGMETRFRVELPCRPKAHDPSLLLDQSGMHATPGQRTVLPGDSP